MTATLLTTKRVEKPWGRHDLWPGFPDPAPDAPAIGEVWFQPPHPEQAELLIKYLFTSDRLSVQNHPTDDYARAHGYPRGKEECWVVLATEPGATIALGPKAPMTKEQLRAASLDGSIVDLLDWKPVKPGDFLYSGAGTVHAIGAGITLIETQQNVDLTYRLYDYGSDRELHLDDGVAVADLQPWSPPPAPGRVADDRVILAEGPKFVLERWSGGRRDIALAPGQCGWLTPITGGGTVGGISFEAGECVLVEGPEQLHAGAGSDLLFAYTGAQRL